MSKSSQLGHVDSLFPHVKPDWWKGAFNELYLRTDGDVVEDPAITEAECADILGIPSVAQLFSQGPDSAIRALDLCCGQGRHSINLAKKYPSVQLYGLDQSSYLIELAQKRATDEGCHNTSFAVGDARQIPNDDESFDLVILMGNSFGIYADEADNGRLLQEVSRVLKAGGTFLVDLVSARYTKSDFHPGGWEWVNSGPVGTPYTTANGGNSENRKLIVCRERQLSADEKWLASREIVIDLEGKLCQDLFYQLRLYELDEMEDLLRDCGMSLQINDSKQLSGPASGDRNEDLGMMAARHLLVAQKKGQSETSEAIAADGVGFYVHPGLAVSTDPIKGRLIKATVPVEAGSLLMKDNPYALAPEVQPGSGDLLTCSRLECSKRVSNTTESVSCSNECVPDVVWCNNECKELGKARHDYECAWLKKNSEAIRSQHSEYDLSMLWLIVRILAERHLEIKFGTADEDPKEPVSENGSEAFRRSWNEICRLRSNREAILPDKIRHWTVLADSYMGRDALLPEDMSTTDMVDLICTEEMNSFALYPKATGAITSPGTWTPRGRIYGLAFYTRGTLMNHDCSPNVTHKPDDQGRMTFHATRDIAAGEECTIAYFDLAEHVDVVARRKFLEFWFTFVCMCKRCALESQEVENNS